MTWTAHAHPPNERQETEERALASPASFPQPLGGTPLVPSVLRFWKNGRSCDAFKIVYLDGHVILAQTVRHQVGTCQAVSVPAVVLAAAQAAGAVAFVWRHDRWRSMRFIPMAEVPRRGIWQKGEYYLLLEQLAPVSWRPWRYVRAPIVVVGAVGEPEASAAESPPRLAIEGPVSAPAVGAEQLALFE